MKLFNVAITIVFSLLLISCAQKNKTTATQKTSKVEKTAQDTSKKTVDSAQGTKCTNGNDVRTIEVSKVGSGCEVSYTKMGETKSIANSSSGMAYCESVLNRVKSNLSGAGYNCQ